MKDVPVKSEPATGEVLRDKPYEDHSNSEDLKKEVKELKTKIDALEQQLKKLQAEKE